MIRIGYVVEGWRDRAFLSGLAARWCRGAKLEEGHYRGSTGLSLRRELSKSCKELLSRGVRFVVILRDANDGVWQQIRSDEWELVPEEARHCTVYGVAARNVEDWLNAAPGYFAEVLGVSLDGGKGIDDPKAELDRTLGARSSPGGDEQIAALVQAAPLREWVRTSRSFEQFYEDTRSLARSSGTCEIPNERGP